MLKQIEEIIFSSEDCVFALYKSENNLVIVPCDDCMSGIYPRHDKLVQLDSLGIYEFDNYLNDWESIDAIIFEKSDFLKIKVSFASDSHDGFQPITYEKGEK